MIRRAYLNTKELALLVIFIIAAFPIKIAILNVTVQIAMSFLLFSFSKLSLRKAIYLFSIIFLLVLASFLNVFIDTKFILIVVAISYLLFEADLANENTVKLIADFIKASLVFMFLISLIQKIIFMDTWSIIAEKESHFYLYRVGYSVFSSIGNATHAAYLTLVFGSYLMSVNKLNLTYFFICFSSLFMYSNKVTLIMFFFIAALYVNSKQFNGVFKNKTLVNLIIITIGFAAWELTFVDYYQAWTSNSVSNIHTISHRLVMFEMFYEKLFDLSFVFLGDPRFIDSFGKPFDSGVVLISFRYGLVVTILFYFFYCLKVYRYPAFLVGVLIPSISMSAFYTAQFILPISILSISLFRANNVKDR